MYFFLLTMFVSVGMIFALFAGIMPTSALQIPIFLVGFVMAMVGIMLIYTRTVKTGIIHLIDVANPDHVIWFYIRKDGSVKITSGIRDIESTSVNKELDNAIIHDLKAYRLHDHSIRFVPEGLGYSADANMCVYTQVIDKKTNFEGIKDGRRKIQKQEYQKLIYCDKDDCNGLIKYHIGAPPRCSKCDSKYGGDV